MHIEEIAVGELVEECLDFKSKAARDHDVTLEAELDDPRAIMCGDRRLLRAAVTNLIETAIRNNRPGGKVTVGYQSDPGRETIIVADNGKGYPTRICAAYATFSAARGSPACMTSKRSTPSFLACRWSRTSRTCTEAE
jgi:signal transduction histidine kinase